MTFDIQKTTEPLHAIPTNIITGFLGVGKTSAILNLLKNKPNNERWAILVNEFGEIGVDGSLIEGQNSKISNIFIREVPGGCMCCAAGLPMQIALNQLLQNAKPDRLLIEPTGLGHPREVLQVLSEEHYSDVLKIEKTLTLIDARKLKDSRYTDNQTFNQQIDIADVIVANKEDLYEEGDKQLLMNYLNERNKKHFVFSQFGNINLDILSGTSSLVFSTNHEHEHEHEHEHFDASLIEEEQISETGFILKKNQGENYESIGWRFSPDNVFNREELNLWLNELNVERLKAVFITHDGIFGYNKTQDAMQEFELDDCIDSRIEIIAPKIETRWENEILGLMQNIKRLA